MPGAFERSIREDRARIRIIFDHGQDHLLGRRPIASLDGLGADETRGWAFGRLLDNLAGHELMAGLQAGLYGASFRFSVVRMRSEDRPKRSEANPEGLPERSIIEANLIELGPTPFPVHAGTSASTSSGEHRPRSATHPPISQDEFVRRLRKGSQ